MVRKYDIEAYLTPIVHQRANSVERKVQDLKKVLTTLMVKSRTKKVWINYLTPALKVLRSRRNRATGMTPAKALLGYELPRRGDWVVPMYIKERMAQRLAPEERKARIREKQRRFNTETYDSHPLPPRRYAVGNQVMIRETRKVSEFSPKWTGPHVILEKISNEVFVVDRDSVPVKLHIDKIRPAPRGNPEPHEITDSDTDPDSPDTDSSESLSEEERAEGDDRPGGETFSQLEVTEERAIRGRRNPVKPMAHP